MIFKISKRVENHTVFNEMHLKTPRRVECPEKEFSLNKFSLSSKSDAKDDQVLF